MSRASLRVTGAVSGTIGDAPLNGIVRGWGVSRGNYAWRDLWPEKLEEEEVVVVVAGRKVRGEGRENGKLYNDEDLGI